MVQAMWWIMVIQLGVAGSMATIGSLNVQWWTQDRSERLLGLTGVLCWSVAARARSRRRQSCLPVPGMAGDCRSGPC